MIPSFLLQPGFISLNWSNHNSKISAPHQRHDINHAQRLFSFFQGHLGDVNSSEAPFLLYMLELASNSVIDSTTWRRCFCVVRKFFFQTLPSIGFTQCKFAKFNEQIAGWKMDHDWRCMANFVSNRMGILHCDHEWVKQWLHRKHCLVSQTSPEGFLANLVEEAASETAKTSWKQWIICKVKKKGLYVDLRPKSLSKYL